MAATARKKNKGRGITEESDSPWSLSISPSNWPVIRAYRVCIYGLIPGVGLLAGPAALLLNALAHGKASRDPEFTAHGPRRATYVLGTLITLTNWVGLAMMVAGLRGG